MINVVVEPDELLPTVLAYARDLADNCSPLSLASIKSQVHLDLDRSAEESRFDALVRVSEHSIHPDFQEGVTSFIERRPPRFAGLARRVEVTRGWFR